MLSVSAFISFWKKQRKSCPGPAALVWVTATAAAAAAGGLQRNTKNSSFIILNLWFYFLLGILLELEISLITDFKCPPYLAMFVMAMLVFFVSLLLLHLLHLFVDFMSTHSHSSQACSHGIYTSMVVAFFVTFMMTPFWRVGVWTWVSTSRRNYWVSTWCHWISLGSWSPIRHGPLMCTWSHRRLLSWVGKHTWYRGSRVSRVVSRGVERILRAYWRGRP